MSIRKEETARELVLYITGEIDHHNTLTLRVLMDEEIAKSEKKEVVVDLAGCDFCDSSALGLILGRARVCAERGAELSLRSPSVRVRKILDLCGAQKYMKFI